MGEKNADRIYADIVLIWMIKPTSILAISIQTLDK